MGSTRRWAAAALAWAVMIPALIALTPPTVASAAPAAGGDVVLSAFEMGSGGLDGMPRQAEDSDGGESGGESGGEDESADEHRDEDAPADHFWRPAPRIAPNVGGLQVVGLETWLAIDPGAWVDLDWEKDGVEYVAVPTQTNWKFSDREILCDGPGTEYTPGAQGPAPCGREWEHTTSVADMEMEVSIVYEVTWTTGADGDEDDNDYSDCYDMCAAGGGGDEGGESESGTYTDSGVPLKKYDLAVGEIQTNGIDDDEATPDDLYNPDGESVRQPDESVQGYDDDDCSWNPADWGNCIKQAFETVVDVVIGAVEWVVESLADIFAQIKELLPSWAKQILNFIEGCGSIVGDLISGILDTAKDLLLAAENPIAWIKGKFEEFRAIKDVIDAAIQDPAGFAEEFGRGLLELDLLEENPAKWAGKMSCEVASMIFGGAGAGAKVKKLVDKIDDIKAWATGSKRGDRADRSGGDGSGSDGGDDTSTCPSVNSFPGDTPVLMADGSRVAIREVRPGDLVLAADEHRGEWAARPVLDQWSHPDDGAMATATLSDGSTITATDDHRFWVAGDGAWIELDQVRPGDHLLTPDGVATVADVAVGAAARHTVWELDVAVDDNFAVSTGTTDVLVHNGTRPCKRPRTDAQDDPNATTKVDPQTKAAADRMRRERIPSDPAQFQNWFDNADPDVLDEAWKNPAFRKKIGGKIRQGNKHEWCMCTHANKFRRWGVPMSEIQRYTSDIDKLEFQDPSRTPSIPGGRDGRHVTGRKGVEAPQNRELHEALSNVIKKSNRSNISQNLEKFMDDWDVEPSSRPQPPLQVP